jgi:hypothetical protein
MKPTRTTNRLPFTELNPLRFEDLCVNLLYPYKQWEDIRHYGRSGADGGVDIIAVEILESGFKRNWIIQCRRYGKANASTLKKATDDAIGTSFIPDVLLLVVACDISRAAHESYDKYAIEKGIQTPLLWTGSILEAMLHAERRDLLFTYFGISEFKKIQNRRSIIKTSLALKKRMAKDFIKRSFEPGKRIYRAYERLEAREAIIRSIDDVIYPNVDINNTGISSWFKVELYDFYHNGLEVILNIVHGIIDKDNNWSVIKYGQDFDHDIYSEIKMFLIGRIPYRNIVDYDFEGDEYYRMPHLYCMFAEQGEPYEGFGYVLLGEGEEYDWPLSNEKQFNYKK